MHSLAHVWRLLLIFPFFFDLYTLHADSRLLSSTYSSSKGSEQNVSLGKCTAPHTETDAQKPYCFVPDTISPEAQHYLLQTSAGAFPVNRAMLQDLHAVNDARTYWPQLTPWANYSSNASAAAMEEFLQSTRNATLAGIPVVLGIPKGFNASRNSNKLLLYLHGGGFFMGSCHLQWSTVAMVAQRSGLRVLCIEYSMAPEHPFPAGLDDIIAVYGSLLKTYSSKNLAVLGDSAGGGLAVALLLALQDRGLPLPGAVGLFSPWVELEKKGDTLTTLTAVDPLLIYEGLLESAAEAYTGGDTSLYANPLVSPLRASYDVFNGTFPPTLIQVGLRDSFLSDSTMLYRKLTKAAAAAAGLSAGCQQLPSSAQHIVFSPWEAMWHVFQSELGCPEAREANAEMAAFLAQQLEHQNCQQAVNSGSGSVVVAMNSG